MTSINIPKKLAIYYGYPSQVNNSNGDISIAVNIFKDYDQIIFGPELENISHPDHDNTISIINDSKMIDVDIFGYISPIKAFGIIKKHIDLWKNMGVKGIFCDNFGFDSGLNRVKQNDIINYIHDKNLIAFINTTDPDDLFSYIVNVHNPNGIRSTINSHDWYLTKSFQIINGMFQPINDWITNAKKLLNIKKSFRIKIACITTNDMTNFDKTKMDYAYFSCIIYNFDCFGWGEYKFSEISKLLPFRERKDFYGTEFTSDIIRNNDIYERKTNIGISINTIDHTTNIILS